ncbi:MULTISPECIES: hypothetical protein [Cryobacterium]|uniref:Uncharacterized protein n=1 Tax=Cryobacterium breve TaxID=1259258 RepID=A0ABY2IZJ7_9MICO|nr:MULTISPECIES: hypothetical protein [Cryobacterium]TFC94755.1 hypothetical protein E3T20_07215 [Cryobacterium sp. TmT3-12]TFC96355.1 hypothetical protein E3O65_13395 [Cryobacterium breve]
MFANSQTLTTTADDGWQMTDALARLGATGADPGALAEAEVASLNVDTVFTRARRLSDRLDAAGIAAREKKALNDAGP